MKKYFMVTADGTAPVKLQYRVYAETEEEAYEIARQQMLGSARGMMTGPPAIDFRRFKTNKVEVKDLLTGLMNFRRIF